jgi:hypothetical protein
MKKLDAIQRKGLSICLGLPATSGRETMEVEGNILPVDLRIEEIPAVLFLSYLIGSSSLALSSS